MRTTTVLIVYIHHTYSWPDFSEALVGLFPRLSLRSPSIEHHLWALFILDTHLFISTGTYMHHSKFVGIPTDRDRYLIA